MKTTQHAELVQVELESSARADAFELRAAISAALGSTREADILTALAAEQRATATAAKAAAKAAKDAPKTKAERDALRGTIADEVKSGGDALERARWQSRQDALELASAAPVDPAPEEPPP